MAYMAYNYDNNNCLIVRGSIKEGEGGFGENEQKNWELFETEHGVCKVGAKLHIMIS